MPKFAANLSMMFYEVPFMERFSRAAAAGFRGVEFHLPYDFKAKAIKKELEQHQLTQVLFNLFPGDTESGKQGLAALPGYESAFQESVVLGLEYAQILNCKLLHALSGRRQSDIPEAVQRHTFIHNIQFAADTLRPYDIKILIEPINCYDKPHYFLNTIPQAEALLQQINRPNVAIQLDIYHCQIIQGNLMRSIEQLWDRFAHIQIASVPYRHEPNEGEINYSWLFHQLDRLGYSGWIGCEYHPRGESLSGLEWFKEWKEKQ